MTSIVHAHRPNQRDDIHSSSALRDSRVILAKGRNTMARRPPKQKRPIVRPPRRRRFRWSLVLVPLAVLLAGWIAKSIRLGFSWGELLDSWGIVHRERYTLLACLGIACVAVVAIVRVLRPPHENE